MGEQWGPFAQVRDVLLFEALRAEYHDGQECDCYPPRDPSERRSCEEYADREIGGMR